jgi:L-lactate dehydrogenase complex protein LldG
MAQARLGTNVVSRDYILHKVRTALSRSAGEPPAPPPDLFLQLPDIDLDSRERMFCEALEKLAGKAVAAASREEARAYARTLVAGRRAVASNSTFLRDCGIASIPGVESGFADAAKLREACASADLGITSADYALADTGTLVLLSSAEEARMISLLPPVHLAIVPRERLLAGLDDLFTRLPDPAAVTSSLVFITGPSRTADIEQILVRGVHGPGEIHVVLV